MMPTAKHRIMISCIAKTRQFKKVFVAKQGLFCVFVLYLQIFCSRNNCRTNTLFSGYKRIICGCSRVNRLPCLFVQVFTVVIRRSFRYEISIPHTLCYRTDGRVFNLKLIGSCEQVRQNITSRNWVMTNMEVVGFKTYQYGYL